MGKFRLRAATLAWALLAPALMAELVVPPPAGLSIVKKDGTRIHAVYLNFNYTELSAAFALDDAVGTAVVPCSEMDPASLAVVAAKIPPVVGWLDAGKAYVCVRVNGALTPEAETAACDAIWQAALASEVPREKVALFQLFGMVSGLLKADQGVKTAAAGLESNIKGLEKATKEAEAWCRKYGINPLTGADRAPAHMEWATRDYKGAVAMSRVTLRDSRRDLMIRLASFRAYIGYCEISGRPAYVKELGELRQKILTRSAVARELDAPACSLMGKLATEVTNHNHQGNNAKLLKQLFAKMTVESEADRALELIFPAYTFQERAGVKVALLSTVTVKINQSLVGDAYALRYFWYRLKPSIADYDKRQLVLRDIALFLEEAVRMGSL